MTRARVSTSGIIALAVCLTTIQLSAEEKDKDPNRVDWTLSPIYWAGYFECLKKQTAEEPIIDDKYFSGIPCIKVIAEELSSDLQNSGITQNQVRSTVVVALKTKLPRLRIEDGCRPYVYVRVTGLVDETESGRKTGHSTHVHVGFRQSVVLDDNKRWTIAETWDTGKILSGPPSSAKEMISGALEEAVLEFAAKYYEDNP
jgi:hypothetical protein